MTATTPLVNLARILFAAADPNVMRRLFERIAVENPEALLDAGALEGLTGDAFKISSSILFPEKFITVKLFNEVKLKADVGLKVEAIKTLRAGTGAGLKEAKDFVEYYFPQANFPY